MIQKRKILFLLVIIFLTAFAVSQNNENVNDDSDVEKLTEDFSKIGTDDSVDGTVEKLNNLDENKRNQFFDHLSKETNIDSLSSFSSRFKEFDDEGNMVLDDDRKINLKNIYSYSQGTEDKSFSYDFNGKEYNSNSKKIEDIKVDDESITYEFEGGSSLKLNSNEEFNPETREITSGDKKFEWSNMNGKIEVDGDKVSLDVLESENGETDLKNFPIIKTANGETISPYRENVDIDVPSGIDKPGEGMFSEFDLNDKKYALSGNGKTYEIKNSELELDSEGNIAKASEAMVDFDSSAKSDDEKIGKFFTKKDTYIYRDGDEPKDKSQNYIWAYKDNNGEKGVEINSVGEGKMYYHQKGNLDSLEINGNSRVYNGDYYFNSDDKGNLAIRKTNVDDAKMDYTVGKIFNSESPGSYLEIKQYEGDDPNLNGRLAVYSHGDSIDNPRVSIGPGGVHNAELNNLKQTSPVKNVGNLGSRTLEDIESMLPDGHVYKAQDKITWAHESVHGINSKLRQENGGTGTVNALYMLDGEYAVINEPKGIRLSDVKNQIPQDFINQDQDNTFDVYMVQQGKYWDDVPTYVLDEFSAYIHGTRTRAELGITGTRGETADNMVDFMGYSMALLNTAPNDPQMNDFVLNRYKEAVDVLKINQGVDRANNKLNYLKNSEWFIQSGNKHFGDGWQSVLD